MIRNEKQLAISRRKLKELLERFHEADEITRASIESLRHDLESEINEYVEIREGRSSVFTINSLDALADTLVKARIARRLTQGALAELLGTSEQMVQKDEAGGYKRASLDRVADVADALEYTLTGQFYPTPGSGSPWHASSSQTAGFSSIVRNYVSALAPPSGDIAFGGSLASSQMFSRLPLTLTGTVTKTSVQSPVLAALPVGSEGAQEEHP